MIYASPGSTFEAVSEGAATGLTGTIGVRLLDGQGNTTTARSTAGIVETPAGSGTYVATLAAPSTAGQYVVTWDTGGGSPTFASEQLEVTSTTPVGATPTGYDLTTLGAVRAFLQKPTADTDQDDEIQRQITAASRQIMVWTGREFAPATTSATRTFSYTGGGVLDLAPYDLRSVSAMSLDSDLGSPLTLTANTDYLLEPQTSRDGVYNWIRLLDQRVTARPGGYARRQVSITGAWGFPAVPADVAHWCIVTVSIWLRRDVQAFAGTFNIDEGRVERPQALPSAVQAALAHYRSPSVA